ncbi:hypothetical protein OIB37_34705 [Streptomyces sp. NBC_00820]|uniref:hypothetical protein n=1 Tax=Streptomyces sp. NBC_00820 TaxID=2975842 RepID=UPI002ED12BFC|nr:hypothetical protein OIB37_34705 [Streptomyces sp. NBC_00820]
MRWWNVASEERAQWVLDPLAGVGPLRFGMDPDQVKAALDGAVAGISQSAEGRLSWQRYGDVGVTAIYERGPRLAAVAIHALDGPQVWLRDVALTARAPSEARADIHELARREGESVRVNWSGDPEVAAWGLSMGATQEWVSSPEGYAQRTDRVITDALLVGPEAAADPYGAEPVVRWCDVRERETNPGTWPVTPDRERPRWDWTPLEHVGPLRFGMSPGQVAAALDGEVPGGRQGHHRWYAAGPWNLTGERYDKVGVTAHYWWPEGVPALAAVTVHGRTGPQVAFAGIELTGRKLSAVDAAVTRYIEDHRISLLIGCGGDLGPDGFHMYVRAARAGDAVVSEARFCAADWEDRG